VRDFGVVPGNAERDERIAASLVCVEEDDIVHARPPAIISSRVRSLPDDLALERVLPHDLVEHDLDVVGGVPVAVVIEGSGLLEDAGEFDAARAHVVDVGLRGLVAVLEGALLLRLAPEDLVVAVRVERRVEVDQVDAGVGQVAELFEAVAAVDDARVDQRRGSPRAVDLDRFPDHLRLSCVHGDSIA
jgi:hypothetical protein